MPLSEPLTDIDGRPYAKMSEIKPGDRLQVDDGFEDCFIPWSILPAIATPDGLALEHNHPCCGACEGENDDKCFHLLDGQLAEEDNDTLVGIYKI